MQLEFLKLGVASSYSPHLMDYLEYLVLSSLIQYQVCEKALGRSMRMKTQKLQGMITSMTGGTEVHIYK
jgi:hypothetical protein